MTTLKARFEPIAKPKRKPAEGSLTKTEASRKFREKVLAGGGKSIYCNIRGPWVKGLEKIMKKKGFTQAGAIEYAIQVAADSL